MTNWKWTGVVALAAVLLGGIEPAAAQTIDTRGLGSQSAVGTFGDPNEVVSTFGQTFAAPGDRLKSFSFRFHVTLEPVYFRFYVVGWDNVANRTSGPVLYESGDTLATGPDTYYSFDWSSRPEGGLVLTPGQSYVGFFSAIQLPNQPGVNGGSAITRATNPPFTGPGPGVYEGGQFVLSQATIFSELSTSEWDMVRTGHDLDFVAEFSGGEAVPEPGAALLFLPALFVMCVAKRRMNTDASA